VTGSSIALNTLVALASKMRPSPSWWRGAGTGRDGYTITTGGCDASKARGAPGLA
jgi:hypothetical protein